MGDENGIFEDEEAPASPELGGLTTTTSRASSTPPLNQHRHIASSDFTGKPEAGDDEGEKATIPGVSVTLSELEADSLKVIEKERSTKKAR